MNFLVVLRTLGILLVFTSLIMVPPSLVSLIYADGELKTFIQSFASILFVGLSFFLPLYKVKSELRKRHGFLIVILAWSMVGLFGSFPFMLSEQTSLTFTDSFFESFSAFTTTGATIITHLDALPPSILFYRHFMQWVGGIGIIVLAVAILPLLGIGGMQLYQAEAPGPVKDSKLAPRIAETAKYLFYIYMVLTIVCALVYWALGMSVFDAICHALSTTSIGGMSTHDESIAYFNNVYIEIACMFFMYLSAINFGLHFTAWKQKQIFRYFADPEFIFFTAILFSIILLSSLLLYFNGSYSNLLDALRYGSFQTVSIITTTGFGSTNFSSWESHIPLFIIIVGFIGGCAGSTAGGIKAIRLLVMYKQFIREIHRLIHPSGVFAIKYGRSVISDRLIQAIWAFIGAYLTIFFFMVIIFMMTGLDFETSFSTVAASINNLGPGLGEVSANYANITNTAKWIMCFNMLLGRVEIFTFLVLFSPMFWRK